MELVSHSNYVFYPKLILRTPRKPISEFIENELDINVICKDVLFMEAVFIASPVLHAELIKYQNGLITEEKDIVKLKASVYKYYSRMSSRCTPFGLFSLCTAVEWVENNNGIELQDEIDRQSRYDMLFLCVLVSQIEKLPFVRSKLRYFPNNTIYKMGNEIRYVEYKYVGVKRKYILSSAQSSVYLDKVLLFTESGSTIQDIAKYITEFEEVSIDEALGFIEELIESQILTSEIEPAITGDEVLLQIIGKLERINTFGDKDLLGLIYDLNNLDKLIKSLDSNNSDNEGKYEEIISFIKKLKIPFDKTKLFQVDTFGKSSSGGLNKDYQSEILEALDIVNQFNKPKLSTNLENFIKKYQERYEDKEMPLLQVLDNETGIGYIDSTNSALAPLVEDISLGIQMSDEIVLNWKVRDKYFLQKIIQVEREGGIELELDPSDLPKTKNDWSKHAPSLCVNFRIIGNGQLFLENAGGSSAINMIGRFAHGNQSVCEIAKNIAEEEAKKNPSIIFAEVVHLPENRTGNVLLHPVFREYELPFLTNCGVNKENQIHLKDLRISIRSGLIFLRSVKLNKQVIPRISTAHNWHETSALPIYKFLGDLQLQNLQQGIFFHWGNLEGQLKFLPRVRYKNVIIKQAQWFFDKRDFEFLNESQHCVEAKFKEFRKKWKLPRYIVLADADNELLFDLDSSYSLQIFYSLIKKRVSFLIKEFYCANNHQYVTNKSGKSFQNQFLAFLIRDGNVYSSLPVLGDAPLVNRSIEKYSIGTEWVYFKIYCGIRTADEILHHSINPLVKELVSSDLLDKFFFIRYNDPDFHLRVRFKLKNKLMIGVLIKLFYEKIKLYEEVGYVYKISMDTYIPELKRYGIQTIDIAEELFYADSLACMKFLKETEGDSREQVRWKYAIKSIDILLNDFGFTPKDKCLLFDQLKNSFHTEFNSDKILKNQLNEKYRNNRKFLESILLNEHDSETEVYPFISILLERSVFNDQIVNKLKIISGEEYHNVVMQLMPSYIHMLLNRIIMSKARLHELVLYDMLFTFYRSLVNRNKPEQVEII